MWKTKVRAYRDHEGICGDITSVTRDPRGSLSRKVESVGNPSSRFATRNFSHRPQDELKLERTLSGGDAKGERQVTGCLTFMTPPQLKPPSLTEWLTS